MDTSELKKCVKAACALGSVGEKVVASTNMISRLGELATAIPSLLPLMSIDVKKARDEFSQLDEDGRQQLLAELTADLSLDNKPVEKHIEDALQLADEGYLYVTKIMDFAKSIRQPAAPVAAAVPVSPTPAS